MLYLRAAAATTIAAIAKTVFKDMFEFSGEPGSGARLFRKLKTAEITKTRRRNSFPTSVISTSNNTVRLIAGEQRRFGNGYLSRSAHSSDCRVPSAAAVQTVFAGTGRGSAKLFRDRRGGKGPGKGESVAKSCGRACFFFRNKMLGKTHFARR